MRRKGHCGFDRLTSICHNAILLQNETGGMMSFLGKQGPIFRYRYVILAVLTTCYTIQWLDRVTAPTLMPFVSKDLGFSTAEQGLGVALMMVLYGLSQWATGWLCDKIGSRKILLFSVISWSLLTAWMANMHTATEWYIRMAVFGVLIGTELVPSARLLVRWFPPRQRAEAQSVLSWAWIVTPAWAPLVAAALYSGLGDNWRLVFTILAVAGSIPLLLILFFVFDRPEQCRWASQQDVKDAYEDELASGVITSADFEGGRPGHLEQKAKSCAITFQQIVGTRGYLPLIIVYIFAQQIIWGVLTWSPQYLTQVHHFKVMEMGAWACVYFIGGAMGSFLSSWISDKFMGGRRKPMIVMAFAGALPFVLALAFMGRGVPPALLLLALTGAGFFSNMVWGPAMSIPADMFPAEVYGKALGFTVCCAYVLAAACPYIMGALIFSDPATGAKSYTGAWIYVACAIIGGVIAALFLPEHKPRSARIGAK